MTTWADRVCRFLSSTDPFYRPDAIDDVASECPATAAALLVLCRVTPYRRADIAAAFKLVRDRRRDLRPLEAAALLERAAYGVAGALSMNVSLEDAVWSAIRRGGAP